GQFTTCGANRELRITGRAAPLPSLPRERQEGEAAGPRFAIRSLEHDAIGYPIVERLGAELSVEAVGRGVPVEHHPFHAAALFAAGRQAQRLEELPPDAAAAMLGQHEDVLEVERRPREETAVRE